MTEEQIQHHLRVIPEVSYSAGDTCTAPDIFLRVLVELVNDAPDLGVGITLYVSGTVVSGTLVSLEAYWQAFRDFLRSNGSPQSQPVRDAMAAEFPPVDNEGSKTPATALPCYIHLRDAAVWTPGTEPACLGTLWRGRLSHVSAWSPGQIQVMPGRLTAAERPGPEHGDSPVQDQGARRRNARGQPPGSYW